MEMLVRLLGGFVATFVVSRGLFYAAGGRKRAKLLTIVGVNLVSFLLLAGIAGFMRAYFTNFEWNATIPYYTQAIWLFLDLARRR
jgi:hypothetical protein